MQYTESSALPEPDALRAAQSRRVVAHIHELIARNGGSIGFAEFMHHALYAPGLGYYAAGSTKFGTAGDFVTAPEVSVVFGRVLARQCAEVLAGIDGASILEYGAGSGKLAADVLAALAECNALPERYYILEVSADLIERQQEFLRSAVPELLGLVSWLDSPPIGHDGVVIANEVLDALPVERFQRTAEGVRQLRVERDGDAFRMFEAGAPDVLSAAVHAVEDALGARLPEGYVSDISLGQSGWVAGLAASLRRGVAFLFDYGVTRREYFAADRSGGWLRCHFRHHAHNDPLVRVGIQDMTAWVDFTAVAEAASASGLDVAGYSPQAQFLLGGGLDSELAGHGGLCAESRLQLSGEIKTLTLPGEMGEHFKCLALRGGDARTPSAFGLADRTHTL